MSLLSLLVASQLAATPITLEEVRDASRKSLDSIRAQLDVTRAELSTRTSRSVIFPQVDLNLGAGVSFIGSQRAFTTVPVFNDLGVPTGFEQKAVNTDPSMQGRFVFGLAVNQLLYDGGAGGTRSPSPARRKKRAAASSPSSSCPANSRRCAGSSSW